MFPPSPAHPLLTTPGGFYEGLCGGGGRGVVISPFLYTLHLVVIVVKYARKTYD